MVNAWTWAWPGVSLLILGFGWSASRYGSGEWPTGTLQRLWVFSNLGVLLGCAIAVMLAWTLGQCLALAHESEAAEQRKARMQVRAKEAQIAGTPDGTMTRDDSRVRPQIKKSYEAMPIPDK